MTALEFRSAELCSFVVVFFVVCLFLSVEGDCREETKRKETNSKEI